MRLAALLATASLALSTSTLTRDVVILGGGSTGTYAAVQLRSQDKTVALVEKKDKLGGHAETIYLPDDQYVNYGIEGFFNNDLTKTYFSQLDVDYEALLPGSLLTNYVDFRTGKPALPGDGILDTITGLLLYRAAIAQFDSLSTGAYYLPDPIPEVLLRPFHEFVSAHALQGALTLIFEFAENVGDLLNTPLLYVIQNFGIPQIDALLNGGYIRPKNGTDTLFNKAATYIGPENIFSSTTAISTSRNETGVEVLVQNTNGTQTLIRANSLLITFPPTLSNLAFLDLSSTEQSLFSKWTHMQYYAATITNTGLPDGINIANVNPDNQPGSLPLPPFQWELEYSGVPGYFMTKIVAPANFTAEDAKQLIVDNLRSMRDAGTYDTTQDPEIAAFASHSPETLMVGVEEIREGFYDKLHGLQGKRSTYYTGYTWCTDYSTPLWNFTDAVVGMMHL
ncbi:FAD/NAD(P)-binding domain-containing protein [Aspergillus ibericus CBS 121593]|uniref:FAD/NAD(P)-binding domain-containing protein n=1 Tax=Aspergillus ibericus CBS 121593 TaxID=1448316 RepID=A0A395H3X4_9EURO|nr:FAD/NAD(P)-binding domain-containing protein [Aspergillus ibericus CBS 121593]RAL02572.1 FAD/NAD(P)-binding domain-containing protein [Aspergillus ibericus CBS 121593]